MHPDTQVFTAEIHVNNPEQMKQFQEVMDDYHDELNNYISKLAKELHISDMQAGYIWYVRSRSRWTQTLENRIICAHQHTGECIVCMGDEEEILQGLGF